VPQHLRGFGEGLQRKRVIIYEKYARHR
jgi:hypothetical protein